MKRLSINKNFQCRGFVFITIFTLTCKLAADTRTNQDSLAVNKEHLALATPASTNPLLFKITDLNNPINSLPFIIDSLCFINDPANTLTDFISELQSLLNGKDTVINIVHLGDSHIQAGYFSGQTMRQMQNLFGNAGRGWIAPLKLSKTNEPPDYYILSNVKDWIAGRCVQINPKCPWGIGGIGIQTQAKDVDFRLIITPTNGAGYSFNKVLFYRDSNAAPMSPAKLNAETISVIGNDTFDNIRIDTFTTANLVDTFAFRSIKTIPQPKSNLYYGFMLMNGEPGILYHAIGVNSAKYTDFTNREYVRRLSLLKPSLLIISLGTNEAYGRYFKKETFENQLHTFIQLVRDEIPGTTIIISTPAETFKRVVKNKKNQYVRNENIAQIAEVINDYSEKEGIASWDLFSITGGSNSCEKWFEAKMFGRDHIHFTRNGYEAQGILLYKAIKRSCLPMAVWNPGKIDATKEDAEIEFIDDEMEIEFESDDMEPQSDMTIVLKKEGWNVE